MIMRYFILFERYSLHIVVFISTILGWDIKYVEDHAPDFLTSLDKDLSSKFGLKDEDDIFEGENEVESPLPV